MNPLSVISSLVSGDSKIMNGLKQAIEIANSGKYTPDLQGALKLASDYGFDEASFRQMEALSNNPKFIHALGLVAPGAVSSLQNMFSQLSSMYLSKNKSAGFPVMGAQQHTPAPALKDNFDERMKKLVL